MTKLMRNTPLSEAHWSKFLPAQMWTNAYYLRRMKLVVFQFATIMSAPAVSLAVKAIEDYHENRTTSLANYPSASISISNIIAVHGFETFAGIAGTLVFTVLFLFELLWPARIESKSMQWIWKALCLAACVIQLAAAVALTVVVTKDQATITGVSASDLKAIGRAWGNNTIVYNDNSRAIVEYVFAWITWAGEVWSTIILFRACRHINTVGPFDEKQEGGRQSNLEWKAMAKAEGLQEHGSVKGPSTPDVESLPVTSEK